MSPGRFSFVLMLLACSLASAFYYQGASWRGLGFPIAGILTCLCFSVKRFMNPWERPELVGDAVKPGEVTWKPSNPDYFWAGSRVTFKEACQHFLVVGATGAGKSITLNLLMQSVFTKFGQLAEDDKPIKRRAVVYDCKADLVSLLAGLAGGMERLKILNPLDNRFTPWDISADITSEIDAYEFAALLIPKNENDSSPYFNDTARSLVVGVIKRFQSEARKHATKTSSGKLKLKPKAWTLRDVILAFESKAHLKSILDHPETRYLQDQFDPDNEKNFAGVKSTADTALGVYRSVAALLDASPKEPISLKDWVINGESILVLGNHELAREATDTLNRLILQQLAKAIIAREGVIKNDETWIFLDELREAGALKGLRQLLLRGRSKGVAVAMGFQDVEGIFAAYGNHEGAEIIGAAQNLVMLHINPSAPKTTQWASEVFSARREEVASNSRNTGKEDTFGEQRNVQLVPNVFPIQFVELPMPSEGKALKFFSFTNAAGYRNHRYDWDEFIVKEGYFKFIAAQNHPDFLLHDNLDLVQLRLTEKADIQRLNLTDAFGSASAHEAQKMAPSDPMALIECDAMPGAVH